MKMNIDRYPQRSIVDLVHQMKSARRYPIDLAESRSLEGVQQESLVPP